MAEPGEKFNKKDMSVDRRRKNPLMLYQVIFDEFN